MGSLPNIPNIFASIVVPTNQVLPIQCKGSATRLSLYGPPTIQPFWHKALEQGRTLESSIGDATYALAAKKQDLLEKITQYLDLNSLAIDGQSSNPIRAIKYAADSIHFIQVVHNYTQEINSIIGAINQNLDLLQSMEANMLQMVQANTNALANLLGEICNWGLPALPSIPYLLGGLFNFNGFNFQPPSLFLPPLPNFDLNFTFSQCTISSPNLNIFGAAPNQVTSGANTYGTAQFIPPLGGSIGDPTQFANPTYIAAQQANTTIPVFNPDTFNPNSSMLGSLPDPTTIISAYQLPPATYAANIITLNPNLRSVVIEPTDPDYNTTPNPQRALTLRQYLIRFVNLDQIVASNFDPNLTATWLMYLGLDRAGRAGQWLTNLQAAYTELVVPSLTALMTETVPYNNVLGGTGVINAPTVPLVTTLVNASPAVRENLLWKLSYIEAGLLGYTRSQNYDSGADTTFLSTFTGDDTDYVSTPFSATDTQAVTLGATTAQYPTIANVPKAILDVFNQVVAIAATNIAGAPNYQTNLARFKFVYNPFAVAQEVDRFTQFWRTFNFNFQQLLAGDPYITDQIVTYVAALDSAIDPLGDPTIATQITSDANSRVRTWVPGTPLLPIPKAPIVVFSNNSAPVNNGWNGDTFNPADFLNRPDIQGQPIPVQNAMLRTNLSYAAILSTKSNLQAAITSVVQQTQSTVAQNTGWHALISGPISVSAVSGFAVPFATIDYDITGYVTTPSLFTIQQTGLYALSGQVNWAAGQPGTRTINLILNGSVVLATQSTSNVETGPVTNTFSVIQQLNQGDTIQLFAMNDSPAVTEIVPTTEIYGSLVPGAFVSPTVTNVPNTTTQFPTAVNISAGTAVQIDADGNATPVDPINIFSPPTPPFVDGIATTTTTAGSEAAVATIYGFEFTISNANFVIGGLVYAGPGGILTQDYNTLITEVNWIVVVGKAVTSDTILFQPQLPQRTFDQF
jgi:hypothetical protein